MLEEVIEIVLPPMISILELMGIFVVGWSGLRAFWQYLQNSFFHKEYGLKVELAHGLTTGLEFKMGAEILKTVIVREKSELFVLAAVIALRAALSFLIYFELWADKRVEEE